MKNRITFITRHYIADETLIANLWYHGNLQEPDFLIRLFDLKGLPSKDDDRFNNAYDDIYQHMVRNTDWDLNWIYTDPRINLLHCEDDIYLRFLAETLHPIVRSQVEVSKLLAIYNKHLDADGFEIAQTDEMSGQPVFSGRQKVIGQAHLTEKKAEIKKYLNTAYVNGKITTMHDAITKDTDLAIGTAKELLETTCKSILKQKGVAIDSDWTLPQLLKTTTTNLDFTPKEAADPAKAEKAIRQILGGIASIVHGVAELRNGYGTGHGKEADFKGLEIKYAKLLVGVVSEVVILYLATNGETAELIE